MQIRIADITVEFDGREERYFVMYPSPAKPESPASWMVLDADGGPVCVDSYIDDLRDELPDEFVDRLDAAARAAVAKDVGEPLEERRAVPGTSALEWAGDLGWLPAPGAAM